MTEKITDITPATLPKGGKRKILPTNRIAFAKQLDILRAYSAASNEGAQAVPNEAVANIVGLSASTVSLANPFFADIGLIEKRDGGNAPIGGVVAFARGYQWDADYAGTELGPTLRDSWFGEALLPRLQFGPLDEATALRELGKAASAEPQYRPQLRMLLEYLEVGHLIVRDGTQISVDPDAQEGRSKPKASPAPASDSTPKASEPSQPPSGGLPLLIQGLLQELPRGGTWTHAKANAWLDLAKLTFNMVYEFEDADSSTEGPSVSDGAEG